MFLSQSHHVAITFKSSLFLQLSETMINVFLLSLLALGARGQVLSCDWVSNLDCTTYVSVQECGTNGITYANRCYFAKAQCKDSSLHILHDGPCLPSESSTTPRPASGVDGNQAVLDFFCTALSHQNCPTETNQVCASDNWTYQNYCEFDKERCTHRDLEVLYFGPCKKP